MKAIGFSAPVLPGKTEEGRIFAKELNGPRADGLKESRMAMGLDRESVWLMPTPMGDFITVVLEGDDPQESNRKFAESTSEFDMWFKKTAADITGVDFGQPLPPIEELWDWRR